MNERIIWDFVSKAREFAISDTPDGGKCFDQDVFHNKFAELIVRECMACSTWVGKMNTNSVEPVHTAHAINQRIKEHFGVEE